MGVPLPARLGHPTSPLRAEPRTACPGGGAPRAVGGTGTPEWRVPSCPHLDLGQEVLQGVVELVRILQLFSAGQNQQPSARGQAASLQPSAPTSPSQHWATAGAEEQPKPSPRSPPAPPAQHSPLLLPQRFPSRFSWKTRVNVTMSAPCPRAREDGALLPDSPSPPEAGRTHGCQGRSRWGSAARPP